MAADDRIARIVGVLFIIGTVAGILSVVVSGSLLDASDFLAEIARNDTRMIAGALFVLIMGLALAMVPIVAFPVLRKQNEALALGYIVFRGALETAMYLVIVICFLVLVPISQKYVKADAADAANHQAVGTVLKATAENAGTVMSIAFLLGALIFYTLLYRARLLPRWLSAWGLIAVGLYLAEVLLDMFAVIEPSSTAESILTSPMFLQEMVMAVWLIVRGFNPSAIVLRASSQPATS